ncbi:hypothetical protein ACQZ46_23845 [Agrobacterium salinitolerans]
MKFLDKAFNKFVTWFDPEESEQEASAASAISMPSLTQSLSRRLDRQQNYRGLGTWEPRPDPFDPEQTINVYIPALEEMSQNELGDIVAKRVAEAFKDSEPTFKTERIRYAVYRIAAFRYGSYDAGFVRKHDELVKDVEAVFEACNVLVKFVEQEIEKSADLGVDEELMKFLRAAQYLITMANRTYVAVVAQESIAHPYANWENSPASLPCWPGLADLAGKEAA